MATAVGQRGKWAEAQVAKWMKKRNDDDGRFAFNRYPDARAGSLQSAPSDFEASHAGTHFKVEVKEVKIKTVTSRRVPAGNFSADKVARMRKWAAAGDHCWVVVCHRDEANRVQEWRLVPLEYFFDRESSWDVSIFRVYPKVDDVMLQIFGPRKQFGG